MHPSRELSNEIREMEVIQPNRKGERQAPLFTKWSNPLSVLWHFRIYTIGPCIDPASQVQNLLETRLLQECNCLGAASAHFAMDHNFAAGIQLVDPLRQIVQRNQVSAQVADLIFMRLAHVENKHVVLLVQTALQFFYLNLRNSVAHRLFLPTNAAKLVVVYQLRYRGMRAAHRAVGVLAKLQFTELHAQGIHQQQAANERFADPKDQFDHFRRLHHANKSGKNSQNSAFGARGNQSRRWRFGIEAAVARSIFGGEDARLPLEAENRTIHIRLAREDASVVHQIPGRKVVSSVGDDVEFAKQLESVGAAQLGIKGSQVQKGIDPLQLVRCRIELLASDVRR